MRTSSYNYTGLLTRANRLSNQDTLVNRQTKIEANQLHAELIDCLKTAQDNLTNPHANKDHLAAAQKIIDEGKVGGAISQLTEKFGSQYSSWKIGAGALVACAATYFVAKAVSILTETEAPIDTDLAVNSSLAATAMAAAKVAYSAALSRASDRLPKLAIDITYAYARVCNASAHMPKTKKELVLGWAELTSKRADFAEMEADLAVALSERILAESRDHQLKRAKFPNIH